VREIYCGIGEIWDGFVFGNMIQVTGHLRAQLWIRD